MKTLLDVVDENIDILKKKYGVPKDPLFTKEDMIAFAEWYYSEANFYDIGETRCGSLGLRVWLKEHKK